MTEMYPSAEPFTVDAAGLTIAGDRWRGADSGSGSGSGTTLVLLHGGGQTRHSWDRTAAALAQRGYTVITLDARGHGDTAWAADGAYALGDFVGDLLGVLRTLDGPPPVLIGASLGGITSLCAVGENPGIASALVLVDVVVDAEKKGIERVTDFLAAHTDGFATLDEVADAVAAYNPTRRRARNLEGLKKNVRLRADGRWYWHWDPSFIRGDDRNEARIQDKDRLGAAATHVTVPTLIVRGGKSDVVSDEGVEKMLQRVPHAEVADVSGAGHMVAGDDNQVFAAAIEDFLDRHRL
ncbi:alpha/beta fold hydrolase [Tsukamurella tyrosinosolvens]|uniref:alpha/beta fold hydrolase n=1 Tax=Tsukamurella tyrosinosolvens TaxID=57704 RepID=UPI000DF69A73|nr:alpha/beta hydrolase [Tsukamurella tyrosinosolvens]QRY85561.1 alpha/beta hydrolase [Tsukamurella tyrosinosolvens]RDB46308.1 alpha/beta hydrolase [Tsukamurella tyrosinosolvens]